MKPRSADGMGDNFQAVTPESLVIRHVSFLFGNPVPNKNTKEKDFWASSRNTQVWDS